MIEASAPTGLPALRGYLAAARSLDIAIGKATGAAIESDIVAIRQKDPAMGADTFHSWLTVSTLCRKPKVWVRPAVNACFFVSQGRACACGVIWGGDPGPGIAPWLVGKQM